MLSIIGSVKLTVCLLVGALVLGGCGRNIQNSEAVRLGVLDYLNQRKAQTGLDITSMDIAVLSVSFESNQAHATVSFRPKGASSGMTMNYTLDRRGDRWVVSGRGDSGSHPHGAEMQGGLPPGHPPTGASPIPGMPQGQVPPSGGALPPGHPPIDSGAGAKP